LALKSILFGDSKMQTVGRGKKINGTGIHKLSQALKDIKSLKSMELMFSEYIFLDF